MSRLGYLATDSRLYPWYMIHAKEIDRNICVRLLIIQQRTLQEFEPIDFSIKKQPYFYWTTVAIYYCNAIIIICHCNLNDNTVTLIIGNKWIYCIVMSGKKKTVVKRVVFVPSFETTIERLFLVITPFFSQFLSVLIFSFC